MGSFQYQGKRIFYEEAGNGKPLLLLHGNTASGRMFAPVLPLFTEKHRVIVPDFLGCGRSERREKWPADLWFDWAGQAIALCKAIGVEKADVIGSSGGALAAVNMALEEPEIVNTVVADSFEGLTADPGVTGQIRPGREYAKQNGRFRDMLRAMHGEDWESVVDADTEAVLAHAETVGSFFHRPLETLKTRLLLTGSAEDELFPKGHYEALFARIRGRTPMAESHIFTRGGHPAMMSNTREFVLLCEGFFTDANETW